MPVGEPLCLLGNPSGCWGAPLSASLGGVKVPRERAHLFMFIFFQLLLCGSVTQKPLGTELPRLLRGKSMCESVFVHLHEPNGHKNPLTADI